MTSRPRIVMIGAGNVATHLAPALSRVCDIVQVYSLTGQSAAVLADKIGHTQHTSDPAAIMTDADIYIVAVKDDAIPDIISEIPDNGALWVHTSGSVGADIFEGHRQHYGVLYPLQSFSRDREVDMTAVPFFVEGSDESATARIETLAGSISTTVYRAGSAQRAALHVAAVFANNFVNDMLSEAETLLNRADLPLSVMYPLLEETLAKVKGASPADCQTGPAARGDIKTMQRHLQSLDGRRADIYRIISQNILEKFHPDEPHRL